MFMCLKTENGIHISNTKGENMEVQCEEIIKYEVFSEDWENSKSFYNIDDVIEFIKENKYSEVRKTTRLIIE